MPSDNKKAKGFKQYAGSDELFKVACTLANTPPNKRQHTKWRQERGLAYAKREEAKQAVHGN